jgi:signal transduction histidine kinase
MSRLTIPFRLLPRSLFGRLALILFSGLAAAHVLSLALLMYDRTQTAGALMNAYLTRDVASSVAILERVPAEERRQWLPKLERRNYRYYLDRQATGVPAKSLVAGTIVNALSHELAGNYSIDPEIPAGATDPLRLNLHLRLKDGSPLMVELLPPGMALSLWVPIALTLQLAILALFTWLAVKIATQPLVRLARAADELGPDLRGEPLPEDGPKEVAHAAAAFNAMQHRIADHLTERIRILAAISHDLQTPITRMRLRADLLDDPVLKQKLQNDLLAMQALVSEGVEFARGLSNVTEAAVAIDLQALLESLAYDYADAGRQIKLLGSIDFPITTKPHALRRIITNLVDNAFKFGCDVEISIGVRRLDCISISVRDHGPGIPETELATVLQPFYRLEGSRNRETGGTGLGLAIAHQLSTALGGELWLSNHRDGGLEARLTLPAVPAKIR